MPRIILARHGQTRFNRDGFIMGRDDSPLTAEGFLTTEALASSLVDEKVSTIFCSPLGRAVASARIYQEKLGAHLFIRDAMAELSCGDWEGKPRLEVTGGADRIRTNWFDKPPGGESYHDAEARVRPFIAEIHSLNGPEPILVVGHAGANRVFLKLLLDLAPDRAMWIACPNDLIYFIEEDRTIRARSVTGIESRDLLFETE